MPPLTKSTGRFARSANNSIEYYTRDGEEIPDYAKEDIEKKNAIADLIEKFIEKNLNPKI